MPCAIYRRPHWGTSSGGRRVKEAALYHHQLGRALAGMGDTDGAMEHYDAAFRVDLTNIGILSDLGQLCMERGDYARAQKTFRALLLQRLGPDAGLAKSDVYALIGECQVRLGDEKKARGMLRRALDADPGHARAAELLGVDFLDHIIIGRPAGKREGFFSFREAGMLTAAS